MLSIAYNKTAQSGAVADHEALLNADIDGNGKPTQPQGVNNGPAAVTANSPYNNCHCEQRAGPACGGAHKGYP